MTFDSGLRCISSPVNVPRREPAIDRWLSTLVESSVPSVVVLKVPSDMMPQLLFRAIFPMRSAMDISMLSFTIYARGWNCM